MRNRIRCLLCQHGRSIKTDPPATYVRTPLSSDTPPVGRNPPALAPCFFDGCPRANHACGGDVSWSGSKLRHSCKYLHQHVRRNHHQWRHRIYHRTGSDPRRRACALRTQRSLFNSRHGSGHCSLCFGFAAVHIHIRARSNQPLYRYDTRSSRHIHSRRVLQRGCDEHRRSSYAER